MNKKALKVGKILGIAISGTSTSQVLKKVASDIKMKKRVFIVTPNPEIVLKAQNDHTLFTILNKADIAIPDGVGLVVAYKFLSLPSPKGQLEKLFTSLVQGLGVGFSIIFNKAWLNQGLSVVKGREVARSLIKMASERNMSIFLLGGESGEAARAEVKIKKVYPGLRVNSFQGPMLDSDAYPLNKKEEGSQKEAIKRLKQFNPDILFVGMSTPRQEKWLYRYFPKVNVKVGMTVGGTFKYLSGERPTPPSWVNEKGLEWLYRLLTGSQNLRRIGSAVWEFPAKVFWSKFTH